MAFIPSSNSVVGFQSQPSSLLVGASIIGLTPVNVTNFPLSPSVIAYQAAGSVLAVSGSFSSGNSSVQLVVGQAVIGSVAVLQGTNPWQVNLSSPSIIAYQLAGSVLAVNTTVTTGPSSVQLLAGVAVIGSVAVLQGTSPWIVNVPTPSYLSIAPAGSVLAVRTDNASVIAVLALSSVAVLQGTNPWQVNVPTPSYLSIQPGGSVLNANISGSVAAAVTNFTASVAANINVISASIVTNQGTNPWVIGSIVGTYAEDAAATSTDKGIFTLHVRNDTVSSVTNADGDYSALSVGPAGEVLVANSPITKWVVGTGSVMNGTSIQVLAAPGTSIFTYITGVNVINESATTARVTLTQGRGAVPSSMITWVIAPAGGGSNSTYPNPLKVLDNNGISASISAVASVYVTITGFNSKT